MKTTLEVPDDLYALVKARAALEGRTLRAVMEELLKEWVVGEARGAREERGARSGGRGSDAERGAGSGGEEERKTKKEERRGGEVER
jgi:plasmid stability protein